VAAALLLNQQFKTRTFVRGITLFPYMVPTIVVAILWRWILNDSYGLLNYLLQVTGLITSPMVWLGPNTILLSLVLVSTWTYFPFVVISVLARLQTIDPELYNAASVDGASIWGQFYHVTLPQLRMILFVVILLRSIFMFTKFDIVWLVGGGGGGSGRFIRTLPIYTYMKTFNFLQVGAGAALAVIMFLILIGFAVPYFRYFRRDEDL
jgi:multiple sugar transport system permease protein